MADLLRLLRHHDEPVLARCHASFPFVLHKMRVDLELQHTFPLDPMDTTLGEMGTGCAASKP